jgi:hypothetical protein
MQSNHRNQILTWIVGFLKKYIDKSGPRKKSHNLYEVTMGISPYKFIDINDKVVSGIIISKIKFVDDKKFKDILSVHIKESYITISPTYEEVEEMEYHILEYHYDEVKLDKPRKIAVIDVDYSVSIKGVMDKMGIVSMFNVPRCMISGDTLIYFTGYTTWEELQ